MSEGEATPAAQVIQHTTAAHYFDLYPSGSMFMAQPTFVRQVYYHDEVRIVAEVVLPDGTYSTQLAPMRVEDVAINLPIEDYVRYLAKNLGAVEKLSPGLLQKFGIQLDAK